MNKKKEVLNKVKLHDKAHALEMLGKHLGIFENGAAAPAQDNNLFDAIVGSAEEDLETDEIVDFLRNRIYNSKLQIPATRLNLKANRFLRFR